MNQLHSSNLIIQSLGFLLQRVHFPKYMKGYRVYLLDDGSVSSKNNRSIATITLTKRSISLTSHTDRLYVGATLLKNNRKMALSQTTSISYDDQSFLYIPHPDEPVTGWPYRAEIQTKPKPQEIAFEKNLVIRIGRKSSCDIVLASNTSNDNIIWCDEYVDKDEIPTSSGSTQKSRFSTDTIMVSTEHASIRHVNAHFVIQNIGKNCSSFIRRDNSVFALIPTKSTREQDKKVTLQDGDIMYVGNQLFRVALSEEDPSSNEPHLDPSLFIQQAYPTKSEDVPRNVRNKQSESLEAQAKRFFSPSNSTAHLLHARPMPAEDQETTFALEGRTPPKRQTHNSPTILEVKMESKMEAKTVAITADNTSESTVRDIPEFQWELSLAAKYQIQLLGWLIKGEQRIGNFNNCDIIIPENRIQPNQEFYPQEYGILHYRRGNDAFTPKDTKDFVDHKKSTLASDCSFSIVRRGIHGSEDFRISVHASKPNIIPNSVSLWLDRKDDTVASMFTQYLSNGQPVPFIFGSPQTTLRLKDNTLSIQLKEDLRQIKILKTGQLVSHSAQNPMILEPGERAIIHNCIIKWVIKV